MSRQTQSTATPTGTGDGTNVWDAVVTLIVYLALAGVGVFLAIHYDTSKDAQGMFGIAAPVLAAAFGVAIGVPAGHKAGKATGKKQGKQELADKVKDVADRLDRSVVTHLETLTATMESPAGEDIMRVAPGRDFSVPNSSIADAHRALAELRGVVSGAE
jgi:hypothetical protein